MRSMSFRKTYQAILGGLFASTAMVANAGCLDDLKQYVLDETLYQECMAEAKSTERNHELHYLVGYWHLTGLHNKFINIEPDPMTYRHFMYLASKDGDKEAMALYVSTEYDADKIKDKTIHPNVLKFLDVLAKDTSAEGALRYLKLKMYIGGFDTEKDAQLLENLAMSPTNYEAKFHYGRYLQMQAGPARFAPEEIMKAYKVYKQILDVNNDVAPEIKQLKSLVNWNMFGYYMQADAAETVVKAEPFLKDLAYSGDVAAMLMYGDTFRTTKFGILDPVQAYAWVNLAYYCSENNPAFDFDEQRLEDIKRNMKIEEIAKGTQLYKELTQKVQCPVGPTKHKIAQATTNSAPQAQAEVAPKADESKSN